MSIGVLDLIFPTGAAQAVANSTIIVNDLGDSSVCGTTTCTLPSFHRLFVNELVLQHRAILRDLVVRLDLRAGLVTDAILAAICIEHGLEIVSADSDFARFTEVKWTNPVS